MIGTKEMHSLGTKLGGYFAAILLSLVLASVILGVGSPVIALLATLYKGYAASFLGALMGIIWGFVHGYVVGAIIVLAKRFLPKI